MKIWNRRDGEKNPSKTVVELLDAIERKLPTEQRQRTRVLSISIDEAWHSCEVEVELTPCVVLLVYYGPDPDDGEDDWDHDVEDLDVVSAANLIAFWIGYYTDMNFNKLAKRIVTAQRRLEIISHRWSAGGTPVEFDNLKIVRARSWTVEQSIPVRVRYRSLNHHLEMANFEVEADF